MRFYLACAVGTYRFFTAQRKADMTCIKKIAYSSTVLAVFLSSAAAQDDSGTLDRAFNAYAEAFRLIDANFHVRTVNGKTKHVNDRTIALKWDVMNNMLNATAVMDTGKDTPFCCILVRNKTREWRATAIENRPGAFFVDVFEASKGDVPDQIHRSDYGLDYLERTLIPCHVLLEQQNPGLRKQGLFTNPSVVTNREKMLMTVTYDLSLGGKTGRLVYSVDIADGFRILSCSGYSTVDEPKLESIAEFSQHMMVEGVWIPKKMREKFWGENGTMLEQVDVDINAIRLNVQFTDDFTYKPPYGSVVRDHVADVEYKIETPIEEIISSTHATLNTETTKQVSVPGPQAATVPDRVAHGDGKNVTSADQVGQRDVPQLYYFVAAIIGIVAIGTLLFLIVRSRMRSKAWR